jgi:hypothetical protein
LSREIESCLTDRSPARHIYLASIVLGRTENLP